MKYWILMAATLWLLSLTSVRATVRDWTNREGKSITAEIVEIEGSAAILMMGGKNFRVPIASLSKPDQAFIEEWRKQAPTDTAGSAQVEPVWDAPWPRTVSADVSQEIEIIREDDEANEYVYASPHYEFVCDVKLNTSVVKRFSLLFEATNQFCRELPLGMVKPFREERHRIRLFETRSAYQSAGGPSSSAGVYISRGGEGEVLVPLTSLGVKKVGSNYSVDYDEENTTLSHEITHQLTDNEYYAPGALGWFTEGLAEYIALSGYRSGKFNVNDLRRLKEHVTAYGVDNQGGKALGEEIYPRMGLKEFFTQDYGSFVSNARMNYGLAALVVYYFFHMEGDKEATTIKNFLKGLKEGRRGEEVFEPLLAGRSWEELEADIVKNWRTRGVRIHFE